MMSTELSRRLALRRRVRRADGMVFIVFGVVPLVIATLLTYRHALRRSPPQRQHT